MASSVYDAAYAALVREELDDPDTAATRIWTDAQIIYHVDRAVREFAKYYPYTQETVLPLRSGARDVLIAALSGLICIHSVETPLDRDSMHLKTILHPIVGDYLRLDLNYTKTVEPTALTGTLTFTNASTAVSASGGAFSTELEADEYIHKNKDTNGEYYKVFSVTDDDNLVLDRPYQGTTGADDANLSKMLTYSYLCRIIWGGMHTLTNAASTLDVMHEEAITAGACAFALRAWAADARRLLDKAQAEEDKMSKPITDALVHIVAGAPKINNVNVGAQVGLMRVEYTRANLQRASARGEASGRYIEGANAVLRHVIQEADRREAQFRADCKYFKSRYNWPKFQQYPRGE
jgi:hypothetical protein